MEYLFISYSEEVEADWAVFHIWGRNSGCQDSESHLEIRAIDAPTPSLPRPSGTVGSNLESARGTPCHSFGFLYSSLPIHFLNTTYQSLPTRLVQLARVALRTHCTTSVSRPPRPSYTNV
jgi:hypothetical protein